MTKGYKATYNYKCKNQTYEVGQEYKMDEYPILCQRGFHYCKEAKAVLTYYPINPNFKLLEIEDLNPEDTSSELDKSCSNHIKIIREITDRDELFSLLQIYYSYDSITKTLRIDRPDSNYWEQTTYDEYQNILTHENSEGEWKKWTYNEEGKELTFKNQFEGNFRETTYHPNGKIATFKNKNFQFYEERIYNEAGLIISIENSRGFYQYYTYNEKNKVLTYKDSYGNFDEYTYDEKGNEIIYKRTENNFIICERITQYCDEKGNIIKVYFK